MPKMIDQRYEVLKMEHLPRNTIDVLNGNGNNDIETAIEEEREEQETHQRQRPRPRLQSLLPMPTTTTQPPVSTVAKYSTHMYVRIIHYTAIINQFLGYVLLARLKDVINICIEAIL